MNRLIIKKLYINNKKIIFNDHVNYIVGRNASGKTTLFKLIRYIFGLEYSIPEYINLNSTYLKINCFIGDREIIIKRELNSNYIEFKGDFNKKVKIKSKEFNEIYYSLFKPTFNIEKDKKSAVQILNAGFIDDDFLLFSKKNNDLIKKIFGINIDIVKRSKTEIIEYSEKLKYNKASSDLIKNYKKRVNKVLINKYNDKIEERDKEIFENILNEEYINFQESYIKQEEFLEQAKSAHKKLRTKSNDLYNDRLNNLKSEFFSYQTKLGFTKTFDINDVFYFGKVNNYSYGQIMLLQLLVVLLFTQNNNTNVVNPIPIIMSDAIFNFLDEKLLYKIHNFILEISKKNNLQYIEFINSKEKINSNNIILDLNKEGVF